MAHKLIVNRPDDDSYGPEAEIICDDVTDNCAEWVECLEVGCPKEDFVSIYVLPIVHGVQHRYFDEGWDGYWAVRSGFCYADNHGFEYAQEYAEERGLATGMYDVHVEVDDSSVIISAR